MRPVSRLGALFIALVGFMLGLAMAPALAAGAPALATNEPAAANEPPSTQELVWRLRIFHEWLSGQSYVRAKDYEVIRCAAPGDAAEGHFSFVVLTQEHRWKMSDTKNILDGGKTVPVEKVLDRIVLERQFLDPQKVVTVGMASVEGTVVEETKRSNERADQLLSWLQGKLGENADSPALYTLNLGKYSRPKTKRPKDTSPQRRVMLIGVEDVQPNIALKTALRDCWKRAIPQPAVDYADYSGFDLRTASMVEAAKQDAASAD